MRVARKRECGPALPMRTQHAPPEEARRAGNVRPEAPLCSPATQGTRLPVQAPRDSQRATLPVLSQAAAVQRNGYYFARTLSAPPQPRPHPAQRASQRSKAFRQTSARSSLMQSGTRGSAKQGASTARLSTHDLNPCLARRPPFNETGVTPPVLSTHPSLTCPEGAPRAAPWSDDPPPPGRRHGGGRGAVEGHAERR